MNNDNFLQLLLDDIQNAEQLQNLLAAEFDALSERLFADLEQILSDKLPLLALLEQHAKQRNQILANASLSPNKTGYEAFAAQVQNGQKILAAVAQLDTLLDSCQQANLRNGRLIRANQNSNSSMLNILRGTESANIYDNRGSATKIQQRRPLSQA